MVDKEICEGSSTVEETSEESLKCISVDEVLILKIEIEDQIKELIVHESESPSEAVKKFCTKYKLGQGIKEVLLKKVIESLQPIKVQRIIAEPKQPRFIRKGQFIIKEVPIRGQSALSSNNTRTNSPEKSQNKVIEEANSYAQSPVIRSKPRSIKLLNNSTQIKSSSQPKSSKL